MTGSLLLKCICVESELNNVLEVESDGLDVQVENVHGVVHEEGHNHEEHAHQEADFGETANSDSHTRHSGHGGHGCDAPDNDHLEMQQQT